MRRARTGEPPSARPLRAGCLASRLVARVAGKVDVLGDPGAVVRGFAPLGPGHDGALSFCEAAEAAPRVAASGSTVVIVPERAVPGAPDARTIIAVEDPRAWFIRAVEALMPGAGRPPEPERGVHPDARLGEGVAVCASAAVGPGVTIGARTRVGPGAVIYAGAVIGEDCCIGPGAVVGWVGLAYHTDSEGRRLFFPHLGGVRLGGWVDVGANACVCRGMLSDTVLGQDVKIGSLAYISHGVVIEDRAWVSASCSIAGHARVGCEAVLGIGASVMDNVTLPAGALVGGGSVVTRDARPGEKLFGVPARHVRTLRRFGPTPR